MGWGQQRLVQQVFSLKLRCDWAILRCAEGTPAHALSLSSTSPLPIAAHFFGTAKAMISSLVTSDPVRLPPVLTTVTNCLPSAPK